jgi:C4-dicarboxylate-specific signal transduction histidine kinase
MRPPRRIFPLRVLVLGALLLCTVFMVAAREVLYARALSRSLESMDDILANAIPSVRHLVSIGDDLRVLLVLSEEANVIETPAEKAEIQNRVNLVREATLAHLTIYLRCPVFPRERERQAELGVALAAVQSAAELLPLATDARAERYSDERVREEVGSAERIIEDLILLNADGASAAAHSVIEDQEMARRTGLVLLGLCLAAIFGVGVMAERRLAASDRRLERHLGELDAFAARAAHDLKGPLTPAVMAVSLMRRSEPMTEKGKGHLEALERSHQRLTSIIDGLLAFARAAGGSLVTEAVSVEEVVAEVAPGLRALAAAERAEIRFEVEPRLHALASKAVLGSIIDNLARNALLYLGDSQDRLAGVRARSEGDRVVIEVDDTGPGMPPDLLARIFRPFERGSTRPGTGLGLATVKRLVDAHGGEIRVRSLVGLGTTFSVRLPRATQ